MSAGRVRKLEAEYDVTVRYTYFPLHPETPSEGRPLAELFAGREALLDDMSRRLRALMEAEGLEYGDRTHTYNSRLAQELAASADEAGVTDAMHDALFRAYFVEGRDISDASVLTELATEVGLDPDLTRAVIEDRRNEDVIDAHWERALSFGISGVPTFAAGGFGVVGAQPYETLQLLMERVGAPAR